MQMLLEAQKMTDEALGLACQAAVLSNRLIRIDNPIVSAQLADMAAQCRHMLIDDLLAED